MDSKRQLRTGRDGGSLQLQLFCIGIAATLICNSTGCSYQQIARCTEPVQKELGSDRLSLASTLQDLRLYCSRMATAHSCIEEEISKCSQQVQDNYRKAIKAETTVIEEVCTPGEAQDEDLYIHISDDYNSLPRQYLQHAPCFKAMLLEGGACHDPYARLKAVTVALDPPSGHRQQQDESTAPYSDGKNSAKRQGPANVGQKHYLITNQIIADMCCEYHALHACYMANTEVACGAKALEVSLQSLNKLNGGMQDSCAKVKRHCAGHVVSSSASGSGGQNILKTIYNLLSQLPTILW
ncbi:uncharacterized protein LOC111244804 isoform X1 [Varroa destructor]|uniref:Uncharacterized protein n=1 Tax=Varroa destructor TaxID=109461 RepID=A0A7M7J7L1_VARDE|nr:uncharacterized protein LOC111244804 isoform X1 [Varroa destructor]